MKNVSPWGSRDLRAETIRDDIAIRLRPICSHLTDEDFSALIERMVTAQLLRERRAQ